MPHFTEKKRNKQEMKGKERKGKEKNRKEKRKGKKKEKAGTFLDSRQQLYY